MAQKTGKVSVAIDGNVLTSKPGASFNPGGDRATVEMSDQDLVVKTYTAVPSKVRCTLLHVTETDIIALARQRDFTVAYVTDNGHRYVCADCGVTDIGDLANGELDIEFQGAFAEKA
jgi:hypothetical protein